MVFPLFLWFSYGFPTVWFSDQIHGEIHFSGGILNASGDGAVLVSDLLPDGQTVDEVRLEYYPGDLWKNHGL